MNAGPFHYAEAERLLGGASARVEREVGEVDDYARYLLTAAAVHSRLALAAATAAIHMDEYVELEETALAWKRALGGGA